MPRDNTDTSPDLIELRTRLGTEQATLNIELGIAGEKAVSSGSSSGGSSGVGGSPVIQAASGGGGGGGVSRPPCFIGATLFTLDDGTRITFSKLYRNAKKYKFAKSFDDNGHEVQGEIEKVYKRKVYDYMKVTFTDGVSGVRANHRYFTPSGYVAIKELHDKYVLGEDGKRVGVAAIESIDVPKGVYVYNARIKKYENYCADGKRVHNTKFPED